VAAAVAALAVGGLLLVLTASRRLLYFPTRQDLAAATEAARRADLAPWMEQGRFLGWRSTRAPAAPRARLVVLHGNAGTALDRAYLRDVFEAAGAVEVLLLEYPGYGPRGGEPTQASIVAACLEAVDAARRGGAPVVLVGESLGSAAAALCAAERPADVDGLVLVTPLSSVPAIAARHYPFVPAALLSAVVADPYRADRALPRYPGPVAFLVAGRDEITFADLALALFEARRGPKRLWVEPGATHNGLRYDRRDPRWREVLEFVLDAATAR
jgi:pimeloyl-ACP methyl ester carboxylesterase